MRHAEILKGGQRADRRRDQIICNQQKRADDGDHFAAMAYARVNAAAVGIKTANDQVVDPDESSKHAHRGDQPERSVTGNSEGEADDVGFARAPIAVQNRGRAFPIDVARTLNVGCNQSLTSMRHLARRGRPLSKSGFCALPFNVADEVSCRAEAIKCSRCRASCAPIRYWKLVSPLNRRLAGSLSETKNCRN